MKKDKKEKVDLEINERKAVWAEMKQFEFSSKEHDFIEITEWTNGEGYDIYISTYTEKAFSLSYWELKAIKTLIKKLEKE